MVTATKSTVTKAFVLIALSFPVLAGSASAGSSTITGYEIVADPAISGFIAPLRAHFLANVGKPLTREVQLKDVKRLQDLGKVAMVRTGTKPYKDGAKLLYRVEANPTIRRIELTGLTQLSSEEILAEFKSRPGQVLDYAQLFADLNKIPDLYLARKGIMYTDVTDVKDVVVEDGRVTVAVREFAMGDLVLKGVDGAEADLVRRAFRVKRGQPIVRQELLTSLCDIFQLSMVEDVNWRPRFDKPAGRVDMVLEVTRKGTVPHTITDDSIRLERILKRSATPGSEGKGGGD